MSMFKASAATAGVSLILPEAAEFSWLKNSWIDIDIRKMSQVMRNLMSNALKFTPPGSSITVSLGLVQQPLTVEKGLGFSLLPHRYQKRSSSSSGPSSWLEIYVKDEGIGIEPEYLPRIFNEVLQINLNKNQGGKGTGMGLLISKGIITELHGGTVQVHSGGPGQGSCFKIVLPLHLKDHSSPPPSTEATASSGAAALLLGERGAKVFPFDFSDRKERDCNTSHDPKSMLNSSLDSPYRDHLAPAVNSIINSSDRFVSSHGDLCIYSIEDDTTSLIPTTPSSKPDYATKASPAVNNDGQQRNPLRGTLGSVSELKNDRLRGKKVLMVDDSPTKNLKMCVKLLQKLGAEVDKAEDGRIAVDKVQASLLREQAGEQQQTSGQPLLENQAAAGRTLSGEERTGPIYDLIVMDNQMPNMTGVEACKAMREVGFTGIIIGLTGNVFEREIAEYIAHGANAVLKKPLVLAELFETLRQIDAANRV